MNSLAFVAAFAILACTSAIPTSIPSKIVEEPSSKTTLLGSDGSVIETVESGSKMISAEAPVVVVETAPIVAADPIISTYNAPLLARSVLPVPIYPEYRTPVVSTYTSPLVSGYTRPLVADYSHTLVSGSVISPYASPVVANGVVARESLDTVVSGSSGTVATKKTIATPGFIHAVPTLYSTHGLYL